MREREPNPYWKEEQPLGGWVTGGGLPSAVAAE